MLAAALTLAAGPAPAHAAAHGRCTTALAPTLCKIRHQRHVTNHWRVIAGHKPYPWHTTIYRTSHARRLELLARWHRRRDAARGYVRSAWSWAQAPRRWCVHTHESADWHQHGAHDGGYQYLIDTWMRASGGRYSSRADLATATVQIIVTRHYTRRYGWGEWSTASGCGL